MATAALVAPVALHNEQLISDNLEGHVRISPQVAVTIAALGLALPASRILAASELVMFSRANSNRPFIFDVIEVVCQVPARVLLLARAHLVLSLATLRQPFATSLGCLRNPMRYFRLFRCLISVWRSRWPTQPSALIHWLLTRPRRRDQPST